MGHCHREPKKIYLLQHHDDGLLVIGWHDKQGQHGCVLGRMCLNAPQRLSGMTDEVNKVACWIGFVDMHQSGNMNC